MGPRFQFHKRYRMERSLCGAPVTVVSPSRFRLVPWSDHLVDHHADVLHHCFSEDCDSRIFPCLGSAAGCRELMLSMRNRSGFCASATWLLTGPAGPVGAVQGMLGGHRVAALQNIGVLPGYRGLGLGTVLLSAALAGFQHTGATRVSLEVTSSNDPAIRLYTKFGFRNSRLLYKPGRLPGAAFAQARV